MNKYMSASWKERREKQRQEAERERRHNSIIKSLKNNANLIFNLNGKEFKVTIYFEDATYLSCDECKKKPNDLWDRNEGKYVLYLGGMSPREIKSYIDNQTPIKGGTLNYLDESTSQEGGKRNNRTKKKIHKKHRGSLRKKY